MDALPLTGRLTLGPAAARMSIDGREYLNFFGSGYLALTNIPEIRAAVMCALEGGATFFKQVPAALGAVDSTFEELERTGAAALGTQASVYFASGYLIGAVGIASLERSFDLVVLDEAAHYNLYDAAKIASRPIFSFAHCDVQSLSDVLKRNVRGTQHPLVLTDGVFATTGRIPPLADYSRLLAKYDGHLLVDESHGFGVVGSNGRGAAEHCGVGESGVTTGATLGKAFCAQGALLGCSAEAAARLRTVPPIRGACAGSPLSAVASSASLAYMASHPELRADLQALTQYLRSRLRELGVDVIESPAPIVAFQWGKRSDMLALQARLWERGIHVYHSTYVGAGAEGVIRCAVFRDHSREDIDTLTDALSTLG